jgi:hypothetical protein
MGTPNDTTENTNPSFSAALASPPAVNPFEKGPPPPEIFRIVAADSNSDAALLQELALSTKPSKEMMAQFEYQDFSDRQAILTEVRMLEKETNLKALPAALVLVPIAVAVIGLSLRSIESFVPSFISGFAVSIGVSVAAVVILLGIKAHVNKETCLNAWTKALEESHARATKFEDERNKLELEKFKAEAERAAASAPVTVNPSLANADNN